MHSVELRDLTPDATDVIQQIAEMLVAGFKEHWSDAFPTVEDALAEVRESFEEGCISRIAVADDGQVVGWIGGLHSYALVWELHPLIVRPDQQGKGIGRALVTDLEDQVRRRGGLTLMLGSDDQDDMTTLSGIDLYHNLWQQIAQIRNLRGHPYEFYQKLGYAIIGVVPDANGIGKPDILMAKRIGWSVINVNLIENLRIAINGLLTNRLRAILTTLGIIIGVGAVIALVSLGGGVQNFVAGQFESLGSNVLFVFSSRPASTTRTTIQPISTREGDALANPIVAPSIAQVAMEYDVPALVAAGTQSIRLPVSGITPNFTDVRSWNVRDEGAFISQSDVDNATRVAVIGTTVVQKLYGDKTYNPIGQTIRINDRVFTVIGVMEEQASGFLGDANLVVFVPLSTAQTRLARVRTRDGGYEVSVLHIQARDKDAMDQATLQIESYLDDAHNITFQGEQDFTIINQADLLNSFGAITGILTIFLGLIAGISLLVGGIGIMNIMLVSVTERTREIGLRKAVGARGADILLQFLIESLVLSIAGGGLGVAFGIALTVFGSFVINQLGSDIQLTVTANSIVMATVVSSLIGIFFGLYPASRAARMRPIDALRFE